MAKKTKSTKKHRFKYAEPTGVAARPAESTLQETSSVAPSAKPNAVFKPQAGAAVVASRDFGYVTTDLRRLAVFAVGLIALELILWYLFEHTGLGAAVYGLIRL
jgi:hypothetical protein